MLSPIRRNKTPAPSMGRNKSKRRSVTVMKAKPAFHIRGFAEILTNWRAIVLADVLLSRSFLRDRGPSETFERCQLVRHSPWKLILSGFGHKFVRRFPLLLSASRRQKQHDVLPGILAGENGAGPNAGLDSQRLRPARESPLRPRNNLKLASF